MERAVIDPDRHTPQAVHRLTAAERLEHISWGPGSARTATVTAITDGRRLALERDRFLELVGSGPELRSGLLPLYQGGMGRAG